MDAAQGRRGDAVTELLRPDVADEMRRRVRVAVDVALKTHDAPALLDGPPVLRLVELLLGERRDQQPQTFQLLRVENAVEEVVEVDDRHQFTLGDV